MSYENKNNKIYKGGTLLGEIEGDKIYKYSPRKLLEEVKKIRNEVKNSQSVNAAYLVAAYHFLIYYFFAKITIISKIF